MARGDHIYVARLGGIYSHHGIDVGDEAVIHYQGGDWRSARVQRASIDTFLDGGKLELRSYEAFRHAATPEDTVIGRASESLNRALDTLRGLPADDRDPTPDVVDARAESRLGEGGFDFVFSNCEHFATWCKTGMSNSEQIDLIWSHVLDPSRYWRQWAASNMTALLDASSRPRWRAGH